MTEEREETDAKRSELTVSVLLWLLIILGAVALFLFVATVFTATIAADKNCPPEAEWCGFGQGSFGDAFGFVTSMFTGLAFLGLILTVSIQRMELRQSKIDRENAVAAFEDQKKVNLALRESQTQQVYEDRVFKLLDRIKNRLEGTRAHSVFSRQHSTAAMVLGLTDLQLPLFAGDEQALANTFCKHFDDAFFGKLVIDDQHHFLDSELVATVATLIDTANKVDHGALYPIIHSYLNPQFDLVIQLAFIRSLLCDQVPLRTLPRFELPLGDYFNRFDDGGHEALERIRAALWPN